MKKLLNLSIFIFIFFIFTIKLFASEEKIKVGLLLPLTGQNQEIGKSNPESYETYYFRGLSKKQL